MVAQVLRAILPLDVALTDAEGFARGPRCHIVDTALNERITGSRRLLAMWTMWVDVGPGAREAWTAATRTAAPNLLARYVTFDRLP